MSRGVPRPGPRRLLARRPDDHVEVHRSLDLVRVPADLRAPLPEDRVARREAGRRTVGIPQVGVTGHDPERLLGPGASDQDRQPRLDRARGGECVAELVEPAVVAESLAV